MTMLLLVLSLSLLLLLPLVGSSLLPGSSFRLNSVRMEIIASILTQEPTRRSIYAQGTFIFISVHRNYVVTDVLLVPMIHFTGSTFAIVTISAGVLNVFCGSLGV